MFTKIPAFGLTVFIFLIIALPLGLAEVVPVEKEDVQRDWVVINPRSGSIGTGEEFSVEVIAYGASPGLSERGTTFTNYLLEIEYDPAVFTHVDTKNLLVGRWDDISVHWGEKTNNDADNPSLDGIVYYGKVGGSVLDSFLAEPTSLAKVTFRVKEDIVPPKETEINVKSIQIDVPEDTGFRQDIFFGSTLTITEEDPGFDFGDEPPETPPRELPTVEQAGSCSPNWNCGEWSNCTNNKKQRACWDMNHCWPDNVETESCKPIKVSTPEEIEEEEVIRREDGIPAEDEPKEAEEEKPGFFANLFKKKEGKAEKPELQQPQGVVEESNNFIYYIIAALILVIFVLGGYFFYSKHTSEEISVVDETAHPHVQLHQYVEHCVGENHEPDEIKQRLLQAGWNEQQVEQKIAEMSQQTTSSSPPPQYEQQ